MAFWISPEIKILNKFKYSIEIQGLGYQWWTKTVQFPKLSQEKGEGITGFGGNSVYKPGPTKWQPITFTFADILINKNEIEGLGQTISTQMLWFSIADILDSFQQDSGFLVSRGEGYFKSPIPFETLTNMLNTDKDKLGEIRIHKHYHLEGKKGIIGSGLDKESIVESWRINDIIVSELDFGQGDYSSDDLNEISVTLSYDIANLYYKNLDGKTNVDTIAKDFGNRHNEIKKEKAQAKKARITKNWKTSY